ncbi:hypothetical protein N8755_02940 [Alphaproteobacteria bacterium]|nr:hypothetical protein [Alphaproteobacteria bacterium]
MVDLYPKSKRHEVVLYAAQVIEGYAPPTTSFTSMALSDLLSMAELTASYQLITPPPVNDDSEDQTDSNTDTDTDADAEAISGQMDMLIDLRVRFYAQPYDTRPALHRHDQMIIDEQDGGDTTPPGPVTPPPPPPPIDLDDLVIIRTETLTDIAIWEHHPVSKWISQITIPADMAGASFQLSDSHADNALFRIDATGRIWWLATPDYEQPVDADGDNTYSVEVLIIKDGNAVAKQLDIVVGDIGPGRVGYDATRQPDGNAELYLYSRIFIPTAEEPSGLANYLLNLFAFRMPETGALTLTWSLGSSIFAANIIRPWLDKAFAAFEAVAHIRFIEIEPYEDASQRADIDIQFEHPAPGSNVRGVAFGNGNDRSMTFYLSTIALVERQFNVLLHEIGHTLGLKHPFDPSPVRWPGDEAERFNPLSIMSYYFPPASETRLQQADIDALQFLYGAPNQQGGTAERFVPFQLTNYYFTVHVLENISTSVDIFSFNPTNTKARVDIAEDATLTRSTYALVSERDYEFFVIDAATGAVRLKQTLSFDTPLDKWGGGYYVGNNVYELVVKSTHYFDSTDGTVIEPKESYHHLMVTIFERITLGAGDTDIDLSAALLGKYIIGSDGNNVIRDTIYPDIIIAGKGDDIIYLDSSPYDNNKIIYHIGHRLAWDGADYIVGFNRGADNRAGDQFVFALESNTATNAISNYQDFLNYLTKGTATLDDDEFIVKLNVGLDADDNTVIEGLYFYFAASTFYHGGRASLPLMQIRFAEPVDTAGITDIFTDDHGRPVEPADVLNKNLVLTDLDYLDDFLGGPDAISYIIVPELV